MIRQAQSSAEAHSKPHPEYCRRTITNYQISNNQTVF